MFMPFSTGGIRKPATTLFRECGHARYQVHSASETTLNKLLAFAPPPPSHPNNFKARVGTVLALA